MTIALGTLSFAKVSESADLLALPVLRAITSLSDAGEIGVAEIDPALSDTAAFCERYGVGMELAANCVILRARPTSREATQGMQREGEQMIACVILATTRVDVNGTVRRIADTKKISFAPMEKAVEESGMEFGAITPIGIPADWPLLIDTAIVAADYVIIGSGLRKSKIAISGRALAALPNAQVIEGLGRVPAPQA